MKQKNFKTRFNLSTVMHFDIFHSVLFYLILHKILALTNKIGLTTD